jgi:hypothetical protein
MEEPTPKSRSEKVLRTLAVLLLPPAITFAFYTAFLPCVYLDIGASASYIREVGPKRIPWLAAGLACVIFAACAILYLRKSSDPSSPEEKTGTGCALGCLGLLFLLLGWYILGYSSRP